jgi:NTE family protein
MFYKKIFKQYSNLLMISSLIFLTGCAQPNNYPLIPVPKEQPAARILKRPKVILVLGGGGSKGVAHVGVLEVLEKNRIPIDLIIGTSIGSAVGAFYADSVDAKSVKDIIMSAKKSDLLDFSVWDLAKTPLFVTGPIKGHSYEKFLYKNLETKFLEELTIPLIIVTTDIFENKAYLIKSGPIVPAIHASSAIPPFFAPVDLYGRTLVDGGVVSPLAVKIAKSFKPDIVIAVDISSPPPRGCLRNMPSLVYRASWIYYYSLSRMEGKFADIDIHPNLEGHGIFEDDKKEVLYESGKKAAEEAMPSLIRKLKSAKINLL